MAEENKFYYNKIGGWDIQYAVDLYGSASTKSPETTVSNSTEAISNTVKVASIDGLVKLNIQKEMQSLDRKLLLIVMVDKSRSIQTAWNQIQSTLLNLMASVLSNTDQTIITELIFFNNTSFRLEWNKDNYKQLILAEKPNGKTCFASAFGLCGDIIRNYYKIGSAFNSEKNYNPNTDCSIVFLTDGSHTSARDHKKAFSELRNLIDLVKFGSVIVHTMGFTPNSRFNDLDGIRRLLGSKPGIYQYAESTDGLYALKDKLSFIFKCIFTTSDNLPVTLEIKNESVLFIENNTTKVQSQLIFDNNGHSELQLGIFSNLQDNFNVPIEIEIKLGRPDEILLLHQAKTLPNINFGEHFQYFAALTRLDVQLNNLLNQIKSHNDEKSQPTDEQKSFYLKSILHFQTLLNDFDNATIMKFPSIIRSDIVNLKKSCLDVSSKFMEIINFWNRNTWNSESNQKLADISYQFVFKNAGRQRRVSLKVARNMQSINSDSKKLKDLQVNLDTLDDIEDPNELKLLENSKQLFSCILSLSDWAELLEEKDVLGFGLSIGRPESVIDDPTQIRVNEVSTTFLGKSSIEDAIALSVDVQGHDKTTGGFNQNVPKNESVAVRGRGREPINAWLPLYLHAEHWKAIKYQIKNIIAYFVTLDPLAFSVDQVNSLFLVLGSMISKDDIGERQLFLIFQLIRTLKEIIEHFKYVPRMKQQLKSIITNSIYLISEQPKNLYVLISYTLVLSNEDLKEIFTDNEIWMKFWQSILEGSMRRSCYSIFNQWPQFKVDSFLSDVFYGLSDTTPSTEKEGEELTISNFMEKLLSYKFEAPKIEDFNFAAYLQVKSQDLVINDPKRVHPEIINEAKLKPIIQLSQLMNHSSYPSVNSLLNIMKFTRQWRVMYQNETIWDIIDSRFGIPPDSWISDMKEAIKHSPKYSNNSGFATYMSNANDLYGNVLSDELIIQQIRAMMVQTITYRISRHATEAVESGAYTNSFTDPIRCQLEVLKGVNKRHQEEINKLEQDLRFSQMTQMALKSTNLSAFYSTIPHIRDPRFPLFVCQLSAHQNHIVFARQKITAVLSNISLNVDDYGNFIAQKINTVSWLWGRAFGIRFEQFFGKQTFFEIKNDVFHHRYLFEKQEQLKLIENKEEDLF